jgi:hypothetical protein
MAWPRAIRGHPRSVGKEPPRGTTTHQRGLPAAPTSWVTRRFLVALAGLLGADAAAEDERAPQLQRRPLRAVARLRLRRLRAELDRVLLVEPAAAACRATGRFRAKTTGNLCCHGLGVRIAPSQRRSKRLTDGGTLGRCASPGGWSGLGACKDWVGDPKTEGDSFMVGPIRAGVYLTGAGANTTSGSDPPSWRRSAVWRSRTASPRPSRHDFPGLIRANEENAGNRDLTRNSRPGP